MVMYSTGDRKTPDLSLASYSVPVPGKPALVALVIPALGRLRVKHAGQVCEE